MTAPAPGGTDDQRREQPTYDLLEVHYFARLGRIVPGLSALSNLGALVMKVFPHVQDCLTSLKPEEFDVSFPADDPAFKGAWLDVYKPRVLGKPMYVKLMLAPLPEPNYIHLFSFHR